MRLKAVAFDEGFALCTGRKLETYKYKNHVTILNNADEKRNC